MSPHLLDGTAIAYSVSMRMDNYFPAREVMA